LNKKRGNITKEHKLFIDGINAFNKRQFYDAHEFWEDLWLNYKLEDANFVQGLIQLAVSYFHFFNKNLNGARSMMKKSLAKFETYEQSRGIDVFYLKEEMRKVQLFFNTAIDTAMIKDRYIIKIEVLD